MALLGKKKQTIPNMIFPKPIELANRNRVSPSEKKENCTEFKLNIYRFLWPVCQKGENGSPKHISF